jgi:hypothetical protein
MYHSGSKSPNKKQDSSGECFAITRHGSIRIALMSDKSTTEPNISRIVRQKHVRASMGWAMFHHDGNVAIRILLRAQRPVSCCTIFII